MDAPPLELVEANHIWSKDDISEIQGRLQQICEDNNFTDPIPNLWKQSIIDEIEAAIATGCCGTCWEMGVNISIDFPGNTVPQPVFFIWQTTASDEDSARTAIMAQINAALLVHLSENPIAPEYSDTIELAEDYLATIINEDCGASNEIPTFYES